MKEIKISVSHTGSVCVAPALPFGGDSVKAMEKAGMKKAGIEKYFEVSFHGISFYYV